MKNKNLLFCGIGSCLALTAAQAEEQKKELAGPNVLFIIMDDMCDWVKFLGGNNQVLTPNLDRLAARGVVFSNAYTAVPLSNPSRTALMTGIQPFVTGVYNNTHEISNYPIADNSLFMPQHFKNNGYKTIISGKIFHTKPSATVMNNMWDDMTNIDGGYGPFIKNQTLPVEIREKWRNYEMWTGPDTDFADVRNSQKIIDYLGQTHDKPFFAAMGFYRPHNPYTAPKRYFDLYNLDDIKLPETLPDDLNDIPDYAINNFIQDREKTALLNATGNCTQQLIRAYLACVSFADDRIGMILDALDASPYADNTMIVLIGDNGFHHGEKERWGKTALWREACHVPFVIAPPRVISSIVPGSVCTNPVSLVDIYPTLLDMCSLPAVENQLAGHSILPLLHNPNADWAHSSISTMLPGNFVVHHKDWNYLRYANGSHELYNVKNDENEYYNLADKPEYKYMVDSLAKFLPATWYTGSDDKVYESVSEDISSEEWGDELLRLNPTYVKPAVGGTFDNINNSGRYFDKYLLKGAIKNNEGTPNCPVSGITHGDATSALAFRLKNDSSGFFEFPYLANAGTLTMHLRNGAANVSSYLSLQKYDEEEWTTLAYMPIKKQSDYGATALDEIITYPVNINQQVKLRIRGGKQFTQIFRLDITPYGVSGLHNYKENLFGMQGRKIIVQQPTKISLYNTLGIMVYEKNIETETELPARIGNGIFLAKTDLGTQKIFIGKEQ